MEGSSKPLVYYDFMNIGNEKSNVVLENNGINNEIVWPIKKELTLTEVQDDVFFIEEEAFSTYILPMMPNNHREKLSARGDLQMTVKDERCVFYITKVSFNKGSYELSNCRNKGHTFIKSRGFGVGQKIWLRWSHGYLEVKVIE